MKILKIILFIIILAIAGVTRVSPAYAGDLSNQFTASIWINPQTSIASKALAVKNTEIRLYTDASGYASCAVHNGTAWQTAAADTAALSLNTWSFVSCSYDKVTLKIFVNGAQKGTSSLTVAVNDAATAWRAGSDEGGTYGDLIGVIDDFRIYNYARTPGQIVEEMNAGQPAPGSPVGSAVAHWKFDEAALNTCSGGTNDFCDFSINVNDLAYSTTTGGITNSGKFAKAFSGATNTRASRTDDADLDFAAADGLTISTWFKRDTVSAAEYLIYKENGFEGYTVYMDSDGDIVFGIGDTNSASFPEESIGGTLSKNYDDNAWHNAVAVKDGTSSIRLYVDGREIASDTSLIVDATLENAGTFYLADANATDGTDEFLGTIDEVKIFRSALTASQVKLLYNQSSSAVWGAVSTTSTGAADWSSDRSYCPPGDTTASCGPVGEWKMDEGQGGSVSDNSGNANTGTWNGTGDHWTQGKIGKAGKFNGSDDWVSFGTTGLPTGSNARTIEGWFNSNKSISNGNDQTFFDYGTESTGARVSITANKVEVSVAVNGCRYGKGSLSLSGWHQVAVVFPDNSTLCSQFLIYLDGISQSLSVLAGSGSITINTGSTYVRTGKDTSSNFYSGSIDQLRIYNYARTPAQIAWDYNRGGPVAWYKFDECQGSTASDLAPKADKSSTHYNGTIYPGDASGDNDTVGTCGSGTSTEMWNDGTTGKRNASLDFDGTNDYVSISDNANLRFDATTADFSLFAWVKRAVSGANHTVVAKEEADNDGWRLLLTSGNTVQCSVAAVDITSSSTITDTNWHYVGCTIDRDGNGQTYIDGRADGTATAISSTAMATTSTVRIGTNSIGTPTNYFSGQIDDVQIFNYALSALQVKMVVNEGAVRFGPATGSP